METTSKTRNPDHRRKMRKLFPYVLIAILWTIFSLWICFSEKEYYWAILLISLGLLPLILELYFLKSSTSQEKMIKQEVTQKSKYKSSDNIGTRYSDHNKVSAAWLAQGMMLNKGNKITIYNDKGEPIERISKGHPYICYTFKTENAAKKGLSSISFIKIASDTNEFISLETLEFGCYKAETKGLWEVIIWGESFTKDMFDESSAKFLAAGGNKKGERIPDDNSQNKPKVSNQLGKATFIRTDVKGLNTYEIHKAPSKIIALEFLKNKSVTKPLYYVIVETPEGNWGKDIEGIYKE